MKKQMLLILFILPFLGYSQKCEVKKDEFTGKELVEYDFGMKAVKFRIDEGKIYLEMKFNYRGVQKVIMPSGTEYFIKLKNDEVLKLITNTDSPPSSNVVGTTILTLYTYEFELSRDDLKKMASSDAEKIRYPNPEGGTLEFELSGMNSRIKKHLLKGSSCIMSNLN